MQAKIIAVFVVIAFLVIGAFGFLIFANANHSAEHACPISLIFGGNCPSSGANFAFYHISALRSLAKSIFGFNLSFIILAFLGFILFFFSKLLKSFLAFVPVFLKRFKNAEYNFISREEFSRWLALLLKRDPYAFA